MVEERKKWKIKEIFNNIITTQSFIYYNQSCNNNTNDIDATERADIWFWNSSTNELYSDSEEEMEVGKEQLDEEEIDIDIKNLRIEEAISLNIVKKIKWYKERKNNLKGDYKKRSRLTNKK